MSNDKHSASSKPTKFAGGGGNDVMTGTSGNDVMYGAQGTFKAADLNNFKMTEATTAKITFNGEGADFQNTIGMYKIAADGTIYDVQILFANASGAGSGGDLVAGKSSVDVQLGAGEQVGFFVVPNAYAKDGQAALLSDPAAQWKMIDRGSGLPGNIHWGATSLIHIGSDGQETVISSEFWIDMFHSARAGKDSWLTPDQSVHVAGTVNAKAGTVQLNFEDYWMGGDGSFTDAVLTMNIGKTNAANLATLDTQVAGVDDRDLMSGGDGNDKMYGVTGNDSMDGGAGNDTMHGGSGNDMMSGGDGNDVVRGGAGDDYVMADAGNDFMGGGKGFDTVDFSWSKSAVTVDLSSHKTTGLGNDAVHGFERVIGSAFADKLYGNGDADVLVGGTGNDMLRGRGGSDELTGGEGADTFVWEAKDVVSGKKHLGVDHVTDFGAGDILDLTAVFKNVKGNHASLVSLTDSADGMVLSAKINGSFVDVVVLDDVHTASLTDLIASGQLFV